MPLSPSETSRLLEEFNHRPKKKLGQNFLTDGNIVHKSIAMADLPAGIPVVEIGPGLGTLTQQLLLKKHQVCAVEIDENLFENLQKSFDSFIQNKELNLLKGDAVKKPLAQLPEGVKDFAVVANLPYAISSPWMESLLHTQRIPIRMVLMLQKEAVQRMNRSLDEFVIEGITTTIGLHKKLLSHKKFLESDFNVSWLDKEKII